MLDTSNSFSLLVTPDATAPLSPFLCGHEIGIFMISLFFPIGLLGTDLVIDIDIDIDLSVPSHSLPISVFNSLEFDDDEAPNSARIVDPLLSPPIPVLSKHC